MECGLHVQVTKKRSSPLVVHACTSTTNPQTLFGWWSLGYKCAALTPLSHVWHTAISHHFSPSV